MKLRDAPIQPALSQRDQQQIRVATARAYFRFCDECSTYSHTLANYLAIMGWVDERRIEMLAKSRPCWVPQRVLSGKPMRDCWVDLSSSRLTSHAMLSEQVVSVRRKGEQTAQAGEIAGFASYGSASYAA